MVHSVCDVKIGSKRVLVWECLFNPENLLLTRNETDILLRTVSSHVRTAAAAELPRQIDSEMDFMCAGSSTERV